jgi:hypothetical protein
MSIDWSPLHAELSQWRAERLPLPIWWRDDDAVAPTSALDQLSALSRATGLRVHLAVIPAHAEPELASYVSDHPELLPIVHGWAHANHSPDGEKKAEFGHPRAEAAAELAAGLKKLTSRFGPAMIPMFVPPWNRCDPVYLADLSRQGYRALSTFTPRKSMHAAPDLLRINTHIDPIDWRGTRGLVAADMQIKQIVLSLQDRRQGRTDASEPFGLLTHHLVHDPDVWTFSHTLVSELLHGGALPADIGQIISEDS